VAGGAWLSSSGGGREVKRSEVFGDRFGVRASSQFSGPLVVGNKSLVSGHPGMEFPQGLLEVSRNIIVKEVSVLTDD
jgi:hypothetical protein